MDSKEDSIPCLESEIPKHTIVNQEGSSLHPGMKILARTIILGISTNNQFGLTPGKILCIPPFKAIHQTKA
jgi:hypothetical protein